MASTVSYPRNFHIIGFETALCTIQLMYQATILFIQHYILINLYMFLETYFNPVPTPQVGKC